MRKPRPGELRVARGRGRPPSPQVWLGLGRTPTPACSSREKKNAWYSGFQKGSSVVGARAVGSAGCTPLHSGGLPRGKLSHRQWTLPPSAGHILPQPPTAGSWEGQVRGGAGRVVTSPVPPRTDPWARALPPPSLSRVGSLGVLWSGGGDRHKGRCQWASPCRRARSPLGPFRGQDPRKCHCEPTLAEGRLTAAGPWLGVGALTRAAPSCPFTGQGSVQEEQWTGRAGIRHGPPGGPAEAKGQEQGAACWPRPLQAQGGRPRGAHPEEAVPSQEHQGAWGSPARGQRRRQGDPQVPGPGSGGHGTEGRQVVGVTATAWTSAVVPRGLGRRQWAEPGQGSWRVLAPLWLLGKEPLSRG